LDTIKKARSVKYLSPEQLNLLQDKDLLKLEKLEHKHQLLSEAYVKYAKKQESKQSSNFSRLRNIGKKRTRIKVQIQRVKIELMRIEEGKLPQLNLFQRWKKYFSHMPYKKQKVIFGVLFIIPWAVGFILFFMSPIASTIWWSLNKMTPQEGGGFSFLYYGLDNYIALFTRQTLAGATVLEVLTSSIIDILIDLPTIIIFSLFIAVLLNTRFKGHQFVKAIFFIPVVYNMTVINNTLSGAFGALFGASLGEGFELSRAFSDFLMQIGIGNGLVGFLTSAVDRIFLIVNKSGIQIIIFIAALQAIPNHLYEAAKVEGATKYETFWKITFPLVTPMILTAVVYTIVDSFGSSDLLMFLTVNSQGTTMATNQPGMYSAISIVYFLANIFIIAFAFLFMRKSVFYYD